MVMTTSLIPHGKEINFASGWSVEIGLGMMRLCRLLPPLDTSHTKVLYNRHVGAYVVGCIPEQRHERSGLHAFGTAEWETVSELDSSAYRDAGLATCEQTSRDEKCL